MSYPNNRRTTMDKRLDEMDARMKRIETRLCRLMIALDIDPNRGPDEPINAQQPVRRADPPKDYPHPDHSNESRPRGLLAVFAGKD
jgi:hypothetical protein